MKILFIFLFLFSSLFANVPLESYYLTKTKAIKLSSITKNPQDTQVICTIGIYKHSKKIKTKELLRLLKENGYKKYVAKHPYVNFIQKSPINISKIKNFVRKYYKQHYSNIEIKSILIKPRSFTTTLPNKYTLSMQKKSYLRSHAIVILKSFQGREIFFDTSIIANITVLQAKKDIKRNEELSTFNLSKIKLHFDKFYSLPLITFKKATLQAKYAIKKDTLISSRDIRSLFLVRRGSNVNVSLDSSNMSISFIAKAIQNGCYGDIIQVQNHKGRKIKVIITGKYQAEVR